LKGDLNRIFEHPPHCREVYSAALDKWLRAGTRKCVP
jgi:hypothetical protein